MKTPFTEPLDEIERECRSRGGDGAFPCERWTRESDVTQLQPHLDAAGAA